MGKIFLSKKSKKAFSKKWIVENEAVVAIVVVERHKNGFLHSRLTEKSWSNESSKTDRTAALQLRLMKENKKRA